LKEKNLWGKPTIILKATALRNREKTRLFFLSEGEFPSENTCKFSFVKMPAVTTDLFACLHMPNL
jgi:hypothetical protein